MINAEDKSDGAEPLRPPTAARIAVIIPHLNSPLELRRCLDSILVQQLDSGRAEIVVVDNGSRIPLDEVAANYPSVKFARELTPGPGPARNLGVLNASAQVLAFIDADCRAGEGWLQTAVNEVEASPSHAVIGGDVRIDVSNPQKPTGLEVYESVFAFRQRLYIQKHGFSGTGNLAMSRNVYEQVGKFGGIEIAEDLDWGQRARDKGFPARFEARMIVYHPSRGSLAELKDKWRRQISHAFTAHLASGKPRARWYLEAAMVLLSSPVHVLKILSAPNLGGATSKARGVATLFAIRTWRSLEMLNIKADTRARGSSAWNRSSQ